MTSKKSGFWTFIFSLMPGAGEMYLGFLRQGVSIMTLFFGVFVLISGFGLNFMLFLIPVIWCYSFFHTHNLRALPDEEFYTLEDHFLFTDPMADYRFLDVQDFLRRHKKAVAVILILLGVSLLWRSLWSYFAWILPEPLWNMISNLTYNVPSLLFSIALIAFGVYLISGKKSQLNGETSPFADKDPDLGDDFSFSSEETDKSLLPIPEKTMTEDEAPENSESSSLSPDSTKELDENDKNS